LESLTAMVATAVIAVFAAEGSTPAQFRLARGVILAMPLGVRALYLLAIY
jgi:hypothetical protein